MGMLEGMCVCESVPLAGRACVGEGVLGGLDLHPRGQAWQGAPRAGCLPALLRVAGWLGTPIVLRALAVFPLVSGALVPLLPQILTLRPRVPRRP